MKKHIGLLIALVLCVVLLSGCTDGATNSEYFSYIVETDGTATITGYIGNEKEVVIPKKIDGHKVCWIGDEAFAENAVVEAIILQEGIESIGTSAFSKCMNLTEIVIPDTIEHIGAYAFQETSIKSITIPNGIDGIQEGTFYKCEKLNEVNLPDSVEYIGKKAFYSCKRLFNITLPDNVYSIGDSAFDNSGLQRIEMPHRIHDENWKYAEIGRYAFADCSFSSITIPEGVHTIGYGAFEKCYSLTEIVIPATVTAIEDDAFLGCRNIEKITAKKDSYAAQYFSNWEELVIEE